MSKYLMLWSGCNFLNLVTDKINWSGWATNHWFVFRISLTNIGVRSFKRGHWNHWCNHNRAHCFIILCQQTFKRSWKMSFIFISIMWSIIRKWFPKRLWFKCAFWYSFYWSYHPPLVMYFQLSSSLCFNISNLFIVSLDLMRSSIVFWMSSWTLFSTAAEAKEIWLNVRR